MAGASGVATFWVVVSDHPGVDVIVPVYNGYPHVAACLESVLANTPGDDVRILVADDASPDPDIPALLASFADRDARVNVVRREENLGFVGNCNAAMAATAGDVVILNADTLVPPGWLDRMRVLAASSDRIATVTPLSNNAEVVSVPQWLVPNTYPSDLDHVALDEVARETGTGEWIELPTAVGFAMYVRRRALDAVGLFNEELFGKGYGEENDLCLRFRHHGYLNLLCDTVFVAHVGGVSFAEAGTGRLHENLQTLGRVWPEYHGAIQNYIAVNPLSGVQTRFGRGLLARAKRSDRTRVLYLLHNPIHGVAIGGTEFHTEDLIAGMGEAADALVLHFGGHGPVVQWAGPDHLLSFPAAEPGRSPASWIGDLLDTGVDVVHIQHAMRVPEAAVRALLQQAAVRNVPVVWSLHDYYALCPGAQLLDVDDRMPCTTIGEEPHTLCHGCNRRAIATNAIDLEGWRAMYGELMAMADVLVAPSSTAAMITEAELPVLSGKTRVIPHGLAASPVEPAEPSSASGPPRVALLGYGGAHKGDAVIIEIMRRLPEVEFHLYGRSEMAGAPSGVSVVYHGRYERPDIVGLLREGGLSSVVLLSVWPETFSYTLSEAWAAGLPVFGADQGAIAERIRQSGGGIVLSIDESSLDEAAATIRETLGDAGVMSRLAAEAVRNGANLASLEVMANEYMEMYRSLSGPPRSPVPAPQALPTADEMRTWIGHFRSPLPAV